MSTATATLPSSSTFQPPPADKYRGAVVEVKNSSTIWRILTSLTAQPTGFTITACIFCLFKWSDFKGNRTGLRARFLSYPVCKKVLPSSSGIDKDDPAFWTDIVDPWDTLMSQSWRRNGKVAKPSKCVITLISIAWFRSYHPLQDDKVSLYMTKFKRTSSEPYTIITPLSPLADLEEFLKANIFALGLLVYHPALYYLTYDWSESPSNRPKP